MKTFTLSLILLAFFTSLFAGQTIPVQPNVVRPHFSNPKQEAAFYRYIKKPQGRHTHAAADTLPKLIARRTDSIITVSSVIEQDSSSLSYSGGRGADDNTQLSHQNYDMETFLKNNGGQWVPTSTYTLTFDTNNNIISLIQQLDSAGVLVNNEKDIYTYDAYNQLTTDTIYNWSGTNWVGNAIGTHHYDSHGNILQAIDVLDSSGIWVNRDRVTYTFNAMNKMTSELWENGGVGTWVNATLYNYVYDANDNKVYDDGSNWVSGSWAIYYHDSLTYNAHHGCLTQLEQQYTGGAWVNSILNTYTYGTSDSLYARFYHNLWQVGQWVNTGINVLSYDAFGNVDTGINLKEVGAGFDTLDLVTWRYNSADQWTNYGGGRWISGVYKLDVADSFAYDANGNETFKLYLSSPDGTTLGKAGDFKEVYTFNSHDQFQTEVQSYWDTISGGFIPTYNYYWWYNDTAQVSTGITELKTINSCVYPNPFANTFTVSYDADHAGQATLRLYDINGRLITRTVTTAVPGSNTIVWDAGYTLPTGTYTYELRLGDAVSKGKLVSQ